MKFLTITLSEAEYGGYNYVKPPKVLLEGISHNYLKVWKATIACILRNIHLDRVAIEGTLIPQDGLSLSEYEDEVALALKDFLKGNFFSSFRVTFWNPSNWSESTIKVSVREVKVLSEPY